MGAIESTPAPFSAAGEVHKAVAEAEDAASAAVAAAEAILVSSNANYDRSTSGHGGLSSLGVSVDYDELNDEIPTDESTARGSVEYTGKTLANGDRYEGFTNRSGVPHGLGIYRYATGDAYLGEWHNGAKHGVGVFVSPPRGASAAAAALGFGADAATLGAGVSAAQAGSTNPSSNGAVLALLGWSEHEALPPSRLGEERYAGSFNRGQRCGAGVLTLRDGRRHSGRFDKGVPQGPGCRWSPLPLEMSTSSTDSTSNNFAPKASKGTSENEQKPGSARGVAFGGTSEEAVAAVASVQHAGDWADGRPVEHQVPRLAALALSRPHASSNIAGHHTTASSTSSSSSSDSSAGTTNVGAEVRSLRLSALLILSQLYDTGGGIDFPPNAAADGASSNNNSPESSIAKLLGNYSSSASSSATAPLHRASAEGASGVADCPDSQNSAAGAPAQSVAVTTEEEEVFAAERLALRSGSSSRSSGRTPTPLSRPASPLGPPSARGLDPVHTTLGEPPQYGPALSDLDGFLAWGGNLTPSRGPSSREGRSRSSGGSSNRGGEKGLGATSPPRSPPSRSRSRPASPLLPENSSVNFIEVTAMNDGVDDLAASDAFFEQSARGNSSDSDNKTSKKSSSRVGNGGIQIGQKRQLPDGNITDDGVKRKHDKSPDHVKSSTNKAAEVMSPQISLNHSNNSGYHNNNAGSNNPDGGNSGGVVLKMKLRKTGRAYQLQGGHGRVAVAAVRPEQVQARSSARAVHGASTYKRMDDQYNAGVSALTGRGVPNISMAADTADGARANELIKASADQGYSEALYVRGNCLYRGLAGIPQDTTAALSLFERAAKQGHARASLELGRVLWETSVNDHASSSSSSSRKSDGVETEAATTLDEQLRKNCVRAMVLWEKAAHMGVSAAHLELAKAFAAFAHQNLRGKSITASTSSSSSSQKEEGEEEALFDLDAHLVRAREVENDRGPPVKIPSGLDPQAYFAAQAVLAAKVPNRGGGPFGYPLAGGAAAAAALEGVGRTTVAKSGKSLKSSASLASSSSSSYDHNHSTASKNSFEALMAKAGRHLTAGAEAGDPAAMFELATTLFLGPDPLLQLGSANLPEARRWCALAAAEGHEPAMTALRTYGHGVAPAQPVKAGQFDIAYALAERAVLECTATAGDASPPQSTNLLVANDSKPLLLAGEPAAITAGSGSIDLLSQPLPPKQSSQPLQSTPLHVRKAAEALDALATLTLRGGGGSNRAPDPITAASLWSQAVSLGHGGAAFALANLALKYRVALTPVTADSAIEISRAVAAAAEKAVAALGSKSNDTASASTNNHRGSKERRRSSKSNYQLEALNMQLESLAASLFAFATTATLGRGAYLPQACFMTARHLLAKHFRSQKQSKAPLSSHVINGNHLGASEIAATAETRNKTEERAWPSVWLKACELLRVASDRGLPVAQWKLGLLLLHEHVPSTAEILEARAAHDSLKEKGRTMPSASPIMAASTSAAGVPVTKAGQRALAHASLNASAERGHRGAQSLLGAAYLCLGALPSIAHSNNSNSYSPHNQASICVNATGLCVALDLPFDSSRGWALLQAAVKSRSNEVQLLADDVSSVKKGADSNEQQQHQPISESQGAKSVESTSNEPSLNQAASAEVEAEAIHATNARRKLLQQSADQGGIHNRGSNDDELLADVAMVKTLELLPPTGLVLFQAIPEVTRADAEFMLGCAYAASATQFERNEVVDNLGGTHEKEASGKHLSHHHHRDGHHAGHSASSSLDGGSHSSHHSKHSHHEHHSKHSHHHSGHHSHDSNHSRHNNESHHSDSKHSHRGSHSSHHSQHSDHSHHRGHHHADSTKHHQQNDPTAIKATPMSPLARAATAADAKANAIQWWEHAAKRGHASAAFRIACAALALPLDPRQPLVNQHFAASTGDSIGSGKDDNSRHHSHHETPAASSSHHHYNPPHIATIPANLPKAAEWLEIAAQLGHKYAVKLLARVQIARYQEGALASWSADEVAKRNTWLTKRRKRLEQKQQDELHAAKLASKLPGSRPGSPGGVGSDAEGIVEEEAKRAPTKKYDDSDTESSDEDEDEDDEDDEDEGKEKGRGTGTHDASNGAGIGAEGENALRNDRAHSKEEGPASTFHEGTSSPDPGAAMKSLPKTRMTLSSVALLKSAMKWCHLAAKEEELTDGDSGEIIKHEVGDNSYAQHHHDSTSTGSDNAMAKDGVEQGSGAAGGRGVGDAWALLMLGDWCARSPSAATVSKARKARAVAAGTAAAKNTEAESNRGMSPMSPSKRANSTKGGIFSPALGSPDSKRRGSIRGGGGGAHDSMSAGGRAATPMSSRGGGGAKSKSPAARAKLKTQERNQELLGQEMGDLNSAEGDEGEEVDDAVWEALLPPRNEARAVRMWCRALEQSGVTPEPQTLQGSKDNESTEKGPENSATNRLDDDLLVDYQSTPNHPWMVGGWPHGQQKAGREAASRLAVAAAKYYPPIPLPPPAPPAAVAPSSLSGKRGSKTSSSVSSEGGAAQPPSDSAAVASLRLSMAAPPPCPNAIALLRCALNLSAEAPIPSPLHNMKFSTMNAYPEVNSSVSLSSSEGASSVGQLSTSAANELLGSPLSQLPSAAPESNSWINPWATEHAAVLPHPLEAARCTVDAAQQYATELAAEAAAAAESAAEAGAVLTRSALNIARRPSEGPVLAPLASALEQAPKLLTSAESQAMRAKMLPLFDATAQQVELSWTPLPGETSKKDRKHHRSHSSRHRDHHHHHKDRYHSASHHEGSHHGGHHSSSHHDDRHHHSSNGHHEGSHHSHSNSHHSSSRHSSSHHSSSHAHHSDHHGIKSHHHSNHHSGHGHSHSFQHHNQGHTTSRSPYEQPFPLPPPVPDDEEPDLHVLGLPTAPLESRYALLTALRAAGLGPAGFEKAGFIVHPVLAPLSAWPPVHIAAKLIAGVAPPPPPPPKARRKAIVIHPDGTPETNNNHSSSGGGGGIEGGLPLAENNRSVGVTEGLAAAVAAAAAAAAIEETPDKSPGKEEPHHDHHHHKHHHHHRHHHHHHHHQSRGPRGAGPWVIPWLLRGGYAASEVLSLGHRSGQEWLHDQPPKKVLPIEVDGSTSSQPATPQLQPETHGVESPVQAKFNNGKNSRRSSVQSRSRNSVSGGDGGSSVQLLTEQQDLTGAAYDASTASSLIENVVAGGSGSPYTDRAVLLDLWTHARGSLSVSDALDVTDLTMPTTKININKNSKNHNTGNNNAVNAAASPTVLPLGFEKTFAPASLLLVLPTQWRAPPGVGLANTKRNTQSNGIENHSGLTKNNSVSGGSEDDTGSIETKSLGLSWDDLAAPLGELWGVTVGLLPHHQEEVDNHHLGEQLHSEGDHHVSGSETAHANNNDHHAHSHHKHHHHSTSHHQRHAPSPKEDPLRVVSVHLDGWNLCGHLPQDSLHYLNAMQELELPHNELAGEIPPNLALLPDLRRVNLAWNNFVGFALKMPIATVPEHEHNTSSRAIATGSEPMATPPVLAPLSSRGLSSRQRQKSSRGGGLNSRNDTSRDSFSPQPALVPEADDDEGGKEELTSRNALTTQYFSRFAVEQAPPVHPCLVGNPSLMELYLTDNPRLSFPKGAACYGRRACRGLDELRKVYEQALSPLLDSAGPLLALGKAYRYGCKGAYGNSDDTYDNSDDDDDESEGRDFAPALSATSRPATSTSRGLGESRGSSRLPSRAQSEDNDSEDDSDAETVDAEDLPWLAINPTEARKWFRLASNMWKNPEAMHELGSMLWRGEGSLPLAGQQDAAGAVALWQAAASAGHQEAQTALGDIEKALQEIITNASRGQAQDVLANAWARLNNRNAPTSEGAKRAKEANHKRRRMAAFDWLAIKRKANKRKGIPAEKGVGPRAAKLFCRRQRAHQWLQLAAHHGHQVGEHRKLKQMALEATMGLSWRVLNGKEGAKRRVASEWLQFHCRELRERHNSARAKEKMALQSLVQAAARRRQYARLAAQLAQAAAFAWFCSGQDDLWPPAWWEAIAPGTEGGQALEAEIAALAEADRVVLELPNRLVRKALRPMPQSQMELYGQPNQGSDEVSEVNLLASKVNHGVEEEQPLWWRRRVKLQAAKAQAAAAKARAQTNLVKSQSTSSGSTYDKDSINVVSAQPSRESHDVGSTGLCTMLVDVAIPDVSLEQFDRDHQRSFAVAIAVVLNVRLHQIVFNEVHTAEKSSLVVAVQVVDLLNETKATWQVVRRAPLVLEKGLTSAGLGACTVVSSPSVQAWERPSRDLDTSFATFEDGEEIIELMRGQKLTESSPLKADEINSPPIQESSPSHSAITDFPKQSRQAFKVDPKMMTETQSLVSDRKYGKLEVKTDLDSSTKAVRSMSPSERRKSIDNEKSQRKKVDEIRIKKLKLQGEREAEEMMEILAACQARTVEDTAQETISKDNLDQQQASQVKEVVKSDGIPSSPNLSRVEIPTKKVETPSRSSRKQMLEKKKKELDEQEAIRKKGEMLRLKTLQLQMSRDADEMSAVLAITQALSKERALEAEQKAKCDAVSDIEADSSIEDSSSLLTVLNSFDSLGKVNDLDTIGNKGSDKKAARSVSPSERRKSIEQEKARRKKVEEIRIKKLKLQGEREAEEMMEILAACQARTVQEKQDSAASENDTQLQASELKSEMAISTPMQDRAETSKKVETPSRSTRKQMQDKKKKELAEREAIRKKGEMLRLKTLQLQMSRDAEEMAAVLAITQARSKEEALESGNKAKFDGFSDNELGSSIDDSSSLTVLSSFESVQRHEMLEIKTNVDTRKKAARSMSPSDRRKSIDKEKAQRKKVEELRIKKLKLQGEREAEEMMEILAACQARTVQEKQESAAAVGDTQLQASVVSAVEHERSNETTTLFPTRNRAETPKKVETPSRSTRKQMQDKKKKEFAEQEAIRKKGEMLRLKTLQLQMSRDAEEMSAVLAITQALSKERALEAEQKAKYGGMSDSELDSSIDDSSSLTLLSSFESVHGHDDLEAKSTAGTRKKAARMMSFSKQKRSSEEEKAQRKKLEEIRIKSLKLQGECEAEEMMSVFAQLKQETAATEEQLQVSKAGDETKSEKAPPTTTQNRVNLPAKKVETPSRSTRKQLQDKKKKELAEQEAIRKKGEMLRLKTLQLQMSRDAEEMSAVLAITQALSKERALEEERKMKQITHDSSTVASQAAEISNEVADSLLADKHKELSTHEEEDHQLLSQSPSSSSTPTASSELNRSSVPEAISAQTLLVPDVEDNSDPLHASALSPRSENSEALEQEAAAIKLQALARGSATKRALAVKENIPESHAVVKNKREKRSTDVFVHSDDSLLDREFVKCVAFPTLPRLTPLSTAVLQPLLVSSPRGSRAPSAIGGVAGLDRLRVTHTRGSSRSSSRANARKPPSTAAAAAGLAAHARQHLGLQWEAFAILRDTANRARRKLAHAHLVGVAMYALNGGMASSLQGTSGLRRVAAKGWLKEAVERARPVQAECRKATSDLALGLGIARRARTLARLSRLHGSQFAALREKTKADDAHYKAGWHAASKTALQATARTVPDANESKALSTATIQEASSSELALYETPRRSDDGKKGEDNISSRSLTHDEYAGSTGATASIQSPLENALGVKDETPVPQASLSPAPVSPTRPSRIASRRAQKEAQTTALFNARAALWESELANLFQLLLPEAARTPVLGPVEVGWLCQVSPLLRAATDANEQRGQLQGSSTKSYAFSGDLQPPPQPPMQTPQSPPLMCSLVITVAFLAQPPSKLDSVARAAVVETANSVLLGNSHSADTTGTTIVLANVRHWPMWGSAAAPELISASSIVKEAGIVASGGSAVELLVRQVDVHNISDMLKLAQPGKKLAKAFKRLGLGKYAILHATAAVSETFSTDESSGGCEDISMRTTLDQRNTSFTATKLSQTIATSRAQGSSSSTARPFRGLWSGGYWIPANGQVIARAAAVPSTPVALDFKGFVAWINNALARQCSPSHQSWLRLGTPHSSASQAAGHSDRSNPTDFVPMNAVLGLDVRVALRLASQYRARAHATMAKEVRANLSTSYFDTRAFLSDDAVSEADDSSPSDSSIESDVDEEESGMVYQQLVARREQVAVVPEFIQFEAAVCIQSQWRGWAVRRRFEMRHEVQRSLCKTASWALWGVSREALIGPAGAERRLAEMELLDMVRGARLHMPARAYLRNLLQETLLARETHREHTTNRRYDTARRLGAIVLSPSKATELAPADNEVKEEQGEDEDTADIGEGKNTDDHDENEILVGKSDDDDDNNDSKIISASNTNDKNDRDEEEVESIAARALRVYHLRQSTFTWLRDFVTAHAQARAYGTAHRGLGRLAVDAMFGLEPLVLARDTPAGIARRAATQELASFVAQLRGGPFSDSAASPTNTVRQRESARHWLSVELQAASRLRQAHRLALAYPRQLSLCLTQVQEGDAAFAQAWRQAGREANNNSSQSKHRPFSRGAEDDEEEEGRASGMSHALNASEQAAAVAVARRALWWDELLGLFALLTFGSTTKRVGEAEVHYFLQDTSLVALREIGRLHFKGDASLESIDLGGRSSWAVQAADGFTADSFVTFADELLARAGARAAASGTVPTVSSAAANSTQHVESTTDQDGKLTVGGPADRGPFAGVLTGTGTGADILQAHNNNNGSGGGLASSLNPLHPAPVPQLSSLLSAESRARLLLLRSHRQRTLRRLRRAQKQDLKGLEEGPAAPVSVDGFLTGELRDSDYDDDDDDGESGESSSDDGNSGGESDENADVEDGLAAHRKKSYMKGAGVEDDENEHVRATARIDGSAIPTASDTDNGSFDFFPDAQVVP